MTATAPGVRPNMALLTDIMPTYISYLAEENARGCDSFQKQGSAYRMSCQIGEACGAIMLGDENLADDMLHVASERLHGMASASMDASSIPFNQGVVMLGTVADLLRVRNDEQALTFAYASMRRAVERGIGRLHGHMKNQKQETGENGSAGRVLGQLAEHLGLATLMRNENAFAAPALANHDISSDSAGSHDLVSIMRPRRNVSIVGVGGPAVRRLQMKNVCFGVCAESQQQREPLQRQKNRRLESARGRYYQDILLLSGHCDLGESDLGLDALVELLSKPEKMEQQPKELRARFKQKRHELLEMLVTPPTTRLGTLVRPAFASERTHARPRIRTA